jgi:hypothetical protein
MTSVYPITGGEWKSFFQERARTPKESSAADMAYRYAAWPSYGSDHAFSYSMVYAATLHICTIR